MSIRIGPRLNPQMLRCGMRSAARPAGIFVGPGWVHKNAPKKNSRPWGGGQKCRYGSVATKPCATECGPLLGGHLCRAWWGAQKCAKKTFRPWGGGQKCRYGSGPLWTLRCCDTEHGPFLVLQASFQGLLGHTKMCPKKTSVPWGGGQKCRYGSGTCWTVSPAGLFVGPVWVHTKMRHQTHPSVV